MKKILIGLAVLVLAMAIVPALEVGECTLIESGSLAGKTVCYWGTITIEAGETTETNFTLNETEIPEIETTEVVEITNNGKHLGWFKNGKY